MIYLLTAVGLTPGGNSTVHVYTQTIDGTTHLTQTIYRTTQLTKNNTIKSTDLTAVVLHEAREWGFSELFLK
jgi:hypothetical protein